MTLRTVTPVLMVAGTRTADVVAGADLSATIADGDTFQIVTPLRTEDLLIVASFAGTTALSFDAGTEPPSMQASLGALAGLNGVNAEVRLYLLPGGRHIKAGSSGMTITGTNVGSNVKMAAYRIPRTG